VLALLKKFRILIAVCAAIVLLAWIGNFLDPFAMRWLEKRQENAALRIPNWRRYTNGACGYVIEFPSRPFENPYSLSNQQNVVSYRQFVSTLGTNQVFMVATLKTSITNDFSEEQVNRLLDA